MDEGEFIVENGLTKDDYIAENLGERRKIAEESWPKGIKKKSQGKKKRHRAQLCPRT